jgi:hypothetical protein
MFFVPQFEKKVGELLGDLFQPFVQFNSIQFNLFHPRIIIHDMGQVKQFSYTILDHYSELQ